MKNYSSRDNPYFALDKYRAFRILFGSCRFYIYLQGGPPNVWEISPTHSMRCALRAPANADADELLGLGATSPPSGISDYALYR